MVGETFKREDGLPTITSNNFFSALESRHKKSGKKRLDKVSSLKELRTSAPVPPPQIWTPAPVQVKSWADCEEDDDDYFAMPVLPPVDPTSDATVVVLHQEASQDEGSEEDEDLEEPEEDVEGEDETEAMEAESELKVVPPAASAQRQPDKQLSRKELKKKELAELDAVLAELGLAPKGGKGVIEPMTDKTGSTNDELDVESTVMAELSEGKVLKKRKPKKDKSAKEGKDDGGSLDVNDSTTKTGDAVENVTELPPDPKDVLKKLASMKKKKSFKDSDSSAKAAVAEASARAAKLAAAKKKEKNHYNQQPVR